MSETPNSSFSLTDSEATKAVELFKDLIRFKTISFEGPHNGQYAACVKYLSKCCSELLSYNSVSGDANSNSATKPEVEILEFEKNKPILLVTIKGEQPDLPGILLNSHYDVVPVMQDQWKVDAWTAVEQDGRIYGRGTQDMKCVCAQYILSLSKLLQLQKGKKLKRNIYLSFVPDEEIGGKHGMLAFMNSDKFKALKANIGVAFDEGLASTTDAYTVFYGERTSLWVTVTATGPTGHGSRFIKNTAVEQLLKLANKGYELRLEQMKKLEGTDNCDCQQKKQQVLLGDVLTLNLTMLEAGVKVVDKEDSSIVHYSLNVIPTTAKAGFDIRVPITWPLPELYKMLDDWCTQCSDSKANTRLSWEFSEICPDPGSEHHVSNIVPDGKTKVSEFWTKFTEVCKDIGVKIEPQIFPAGTDSRYLRAVDIPAFGFSPMNNSPVLLHEHNEYLDKAVFLKGIEVYINVLDRLANF